jgi:hypothetical protein
VACDRESLGRFTGEQLAELLEEHIRLVVRAVRFDAGVWVHAWHQVEAVWEEFRSRYGAADPIDMPRQLDITDQTAG